MHHDNDLATALVDVVHVGDTLIKVVWLKWILCREIVASLLILEAERGLFGHHSSFIMEQLMPLPIPSRATLSPCLMRPASTAFAKVIGKDAGPMLPSSS